MIGGVPDSDVGHGLASMPLPAPPETDPLTEKWLRTVEPPWRRRLLLDAYRRLVKPPRWVYGIVPNEDGPGGPHRQGAEPVIFLPYVSGTTQQEQATGPTGLEPGAVMDAQVARHGAEGEAGAAVDDSVAVDPVAVEAMWHYANPNELTSLAVEPDGKAIWAGSHGGGLLRWDVATGTYTRFTAPGDLPDNRVLTVEIDPEGSKWVGTADGAAQLKAGSFRWERVLLAYGTPLDGPVRAIHVDRGGAVWFGIFGQGIRRRSPDGRWSTMLGPHLRFRDASTERTEAVSPVSTFVSLPAQGEIAGTLAWYGDACTAIQPQADVAGKIALIEFPVETCTTTGAEVSARQAALQGAEAVVLFGPMNAGSSPLLYQMDLSAARIGIPIVFLYSDPHHDPGGRLRDRLIAGGRVDVVLEDDGMPDLARFVSTLHVDGRDDVWIGTLGTGLFRRENATGRWSQLSRDPPLLARWAGGQVSYPALELMNTLPIAFTGRLEAKLAWANTGCPDDREIGDLDGRIALTWTSNRCTAEERMTNLARRGALAVVWFDGFENLTNRVNLASIGLGVISVPRGSQLPGVRINALAGRELRERIFRGEALVVVLPERLPGDLVRDIAEDRQGNLWVAAQENQSFGSSLSTTGGLSRIDPARGQVTTLGMDWKPAATGDQYFVVEPGEQYNAISEDPNGVLWFGTEGGLRTVDPEGQWSWDSAASTGDQLTDDHIRALALSPRGDLWLATTGGLARRARETGAWSRFAADANIGSNWITSITTDRLANVWFGTGEPHLRTFVPEPFVSQAGVARLHSDERSWSAYTRRSTTGALPSDNVNAVFSDSRGVTWAATSEGLSRFTPASGRWSALPATQTAILEVEFPSSRAIYPAVETLFTFSVGRREGPLAYFGSGCLATPRQDLRGRIALIEFVPGQGCSATTQLAVAQEAGATAAVFSVGNRQDLLVDSIVSATILPSVEIQDRTGARLRDRLLAGETLQVVLRSGQWTDDAWAASADPEVFDIAEDAGGRLWFASFSSLDRLGADGVWRNFHGFNTPYPLRAPSGARATFPDFESVAVDPNGRKWLGSLLGTIYLSPDDDRLVPFGPAAGRLALATADDFAFDRSGNVWIATRGNGLGFVKADLSDVRTYSRASTGGGLASDFMNDGVFDADGNGWFATEGGVNRLSPSGRLAALTGGVRAASAVALARDGGVWIGTAGNGVTRLSPRDPGADCAGAMPLSAGAVVSTTLSGPDDVDLYAIEVAKPFSRLEFTLPDPDNRVDLFLRRSCKAISSTGRHISSTGRHISSTGRHIGADRRLVFDVMAETGTYYVEVRPRIGATGHAIPYRLRSGLSPVDLGSRRTLILTDFTAVSNAFGLAPDGPEMTAWKDALQSLEGDTTVAGVLISNLRTETSDTVRTAYDAWLRNEDPAMTNTRANALATALRDWVWQKRASDLPRLQYVVIAGDDRIIPHFRVDIQGEAGDPAWQSEADYLAQAGINPDSTIGAALAAGLTPSDDPYGVPQAPDDAPGIPPGAVTAPELAVGRLVETPGEMTAVVEAYFAGDGRLKLGHALVAGYDSMLDAAIEADGHLHAAGLPYGGRDRLLGGTWNGDLLRQKLFGARQDLAFLAVHGNHFWHDAPGGGLVTADQLASASADLSGTLAVNLSGHGGLNVPGRDHGQATDFAEAWARQGATYIGATGWAYGYDGQLQYQEKLMAQLVRLLTLDKGAAVGDALVQAKQEYTRDAWAETAYHRRTLAGTILYGLPMVRLDVEPPVAAIAAGTELTAWGLDAADLAEAMPGRTVSGRSELAPGVVRQTARYDIESLTRIDGREGAYYTLAGVQPLVEAGEGLQPEARVVLGEVQTAGDSLAARGVLWMGGRYRDVGPIQPALGYAVAIGKDARRPGGRPALEGAGWQPGLPVVLRTAPRTEGLGTLLVAARDATLLLTLGQYEGGRGRQWLAEALVVEEYYSKAADREAPEVEVTRASDAGRLRLTVRATDASGISRVVAVWTEGGAEWRAAELARGGDGVWVADLPAGAVVAAVQAVDGAGNVGMGR